MFPMQVHRTNSDKLSSQKTDAAIKEYVYHAFWKDDVLRAMEYSEIDVHVKNGVVYLDGHIVSTISQRRVENAMRAIPGILRIENNLILDDRLTHEVAASLGNLEETYHCKFFTGASHGVISLNGVVSDERVKSLAEKSVASNPNVRAVINHVRVSGTELELQDERFLQPTIGEIIYFLDGLSGVVQQVIINPDNRRVIAMILLGKFSDQQHKLSVSTDGKGWSAEQLVVVPMNEVRHLTRDSGFLYIKSNDRNRYMEFSPVRFFAPHMGWKAPHPYCIDDVLFPVEKKKVEYQILEHLPRSPFVVMWEEQSLKEELLFNDSLGG